MAQTVPQTFSMDGWSASETLPRVSIIIPSFSGCHWLVPCLRALLAQTYSAHEIVVVDNGSTDGSIELVTTQFPQARLICYQTNRGFAAAINAGVCATAAPLIATLNNDTVVDVHWLQRLVEASSADERIGMVASKMLFVEPAGIINSAGINIDRAGIAWDRLGGQRDDVSDNKIVDVFGACAGAALYRRAMFDDIGLFDEDFFAYMEDVDLAWRAQLAGWRAVYAPTARVTHWHSATSIEGSPFKSRLLGRNKVWLIAKNYPSPYLWFYLPLIGIYDLAAVCYALCVRRELAPLQGRLLGLWGLPRFWMKRQLTQAMRRVPSAAVLARMAPLSNPLAVLRRYLHLRPRAT